MAIVEGTYICKISIKLQFYLKLSYTAAGAEAKLDEAKIAVWKAPCSWAGWSDLPPKTVPSCFL